MKKIRIAGPPGTGKTTDLVKTYYSHLDEYDPTDIIVISHTNAAANHIRDRISDDKSVLSFEKDTGKNIFGLIFWFYADSQFWSLNGDCFYGFTNYFA